MVIASGIGAQIGLAEEASYGTYQAPSRFLEFESESIKTEIGKIRATGIGGGRFQKTNYIKTYTKSAGGGIAWTLQTKGFGLLLKHCLGAVSTSNTGAAYTHTITPDASALLGKYLTVQVGRPDITGTSRPFSFLGGKITQWELAADLDAAVKLSTTMDFKTVDTTQTLASASYPSAPELFTFVDGALTVGGSTRSVTGFKVSGNNALKTDRRYLGNTKKEPLANGIAEIAGEFTVEFESLSDFASATAGTQAALVLTLTSASEISAGVPYLMTVTIPAIEFTNAEPAVGGPDVLTTAIPFMALKNASDPVITVAYKTTDTTP